MYHLRTTVVEYFGRTTGTINCQPFCGSTVTQRFQRPFLKMVLYFTNDENWASNKTFKNFKLVSLLCLAMVEANHKNSSQCTYFVLVDNNARFWHMSHLASSCLCASSIVLVRMWWVAQLEWWTGVCKQMSHK